MNFYFFLSQKVNNVSQFPNGTTDLTSGTHSLWLSETTVGGWTTTSGTLLGTSGTLGSILTSGTLFLLHLLVVLARTKTSAFLETVHDDEE